MVLVIINNYRHNSIMSWHSLVCSWVLVVGDGSDIWAYRAAMIWNDA